MYYYAAGDQQKGPIAPEQLRSAGVEADTLVWREGMAGWVAASTVPELASYFGQVETAGWSAPTPAYQPPQGYVQAPSYPPAPGYLQPMSYAQPMSSPQQVGYAAPQAQAPQGMCIASLVLGILAVPFSCFYFVGIPMSILAIILGHAGQSAYKRNAGRSNGMATAGLICGYSWLALMLLFVIFFFAIGVAAVSSGNSRRGW